jgi:hypothetical protein
MEVLLAPPLAFTAYLVLAWILSMFGRLLAGKTESSAAKSSIYAGGEAPPVSRAMPGYRPFFVIALFFAVLHLGVLMLGSSDLSSVSGVYLVGLVLALIALILG